MPYTVPHDAAVLFEDYARLRIVRAILREIDPRSVGDMFDDGLSILKAAQTPVDTMIRKAESRIRSEYT